MSAEAMFEGTSSPLVQEWKIALRRVASPPRITGRDSWSSSAGDDVEEPEQHEGEHRDAEDGGGGEDATRRSGGGVGVRVVAAGSVCTTRGA